VAGASARHHPCATSKDSAGNFPALNAPAEHLEGAARHAAGKVKNETPSPAAPGKC